MADLVSDYKQNPNQNHSIQGSKKIIITGQLRDNNAPKIKSNSKFLRGTKIRRFHQKKKFKH